MTENKFNIRNFFRRTAFRMNILVAFGLLLCYTGAILHPKFFWPVSLTGIFYPLLLILNVFFCIFWIVAHKKQFLLSLFTIALGANFAFRYFQISFTNKSEPVKTETELKLKVLSFNVRLFNLYKWVKKDDARSQIIQFIREEEPDVICLQEFYTREKGKFSENNFFSQLPGIKYKYINYAFRRKGVSNFGIVTYSRYPIVESNEIDFPNSYNQCIYTDIKIGDDTIRVYNTHLQSFRFLKQNYDFIDSLRLQHKPNKIKGFRDILYRIKTAVIKRANQADSISESVSKTNHPVIICGDFNDSPISYSYQTLSSGLKDAFIESGSGFSNTYISKFPSFRIDYILHTPNLNSLKYVSPNLDLSDHNPVVCYLSKKRKSEKQ